MAKHVPHIQIEMDSIKDVPQVWIDGKRVDDLPKHGLVDVTLHWHTDADSVPYKWCSIGWLSTGGKSHRITEDNTSKANTDNA